MYWEGIYTRGCIPGGVYPGISLPSWFKGYTRRHLSEEKPGYDKTPEKTLEWSTIIGLIAEMTVLTFRHILDIPAHSPVLKPATRATFNTFSQEQGPWQWQASPPLGV